MKNKKGNVDVTVIIIVVMAIIIGVIIWLIVTKTQTPIQDKIATPQQTKSVAQTQIDTPGQNSKLIAENTKTFIVAGKYVKGPQSQQEWGLGPRMDGLYFIADNINDLPSGSNSNRTFFFSNDEEELFGLKNETVDNGNGNICGFFGKATIEISNYDSQGDLLPVSNDSAKLNRIVKKEAYNKNCFNYKE